MTSFASDSFDQVELSAEELLLMQLEEYLDGELDTQSSAALESRLESDDRLAAMLQRLRKERSVRRRVFALSEIDAAVDSIIKQARTQASAEAQANATKANAGRANATAWRTGRINQWVPSWGWGTALAACLTFGVIGGAWWQNAGAYPRGVPGQIVGALQNPVGGISSVGNESFPKTAQPVHAASINVIVLDARGNFLDRVQVTNQTQLDQFALSRGLTRLSLMPDGLASDAPREITLVGIKR